MMVVIPKTVEIYLEGKLQKTIDDELKQCPKENDTTFSGKFKLFKKTKTRTLNLEFIYNALMSIKPSSVAAERDFSVAGNFATKIQSRLGVESLCAMIFLKHWFRKIDSMVS